MKGPQCDVASSSSVFLSYGRADAEEFAKRLAHDLKEKGGHRVFLDLTGIESGGLFEIRIEQGIRNSSVLLAVMTPHSLRDESVCRDEVVFALNEKKDIVPIQLDPEVRPSLLLARRNWVDFSRDYDRGLKDLLRYLGGDQKCLRKPVLGLVGGVVPLDFGTEIANHAQNFCGRTWLLKEIDAWLAKPSAKPFLIVAKPGMGKSAITAWLSLERAEAVLATHFCTQQNLRSKNPFDFVANLVGLLHVRLPGFHEEVDKRHPELRRSSASDMFRELIIDPCLVLSNKEAHPEPMMILVDALDEAELTEGETIVDVIRSQAKSLPPWLRLVMTSRPEPSVMSKLSGLGTHEIRAEGNANQKDLRDFVESRIATLTTDVAEANWGSFATDRICELAQGNFLYARLVLDALRDGDLDVDALERLSPSLDGLYLDAFNRRFSAADRYQDETSAVLCPLAVAESPLSLEDLKQISGLPGGKVNLQLQKVKSFLRTSGSGKDTVYSLFHRSMQDWLLDPEVSGIYYCDESLGHRALAEYGWSLYQTSELDGHAYFQVYLPDHLLAGGFEDRLLIFLADLHQLELAVDRGSGHNWMRFLCLLSDRLDPAEEFRKALDQTRLEGAALGTIGGFANKVARLLLEYGLFEEAELFAQEAVHCTEQENGPDHPRLGECLRDLAEIHRNLGQLGPAHQGFERALRIATKNFGENSRQVARLLNDFANYHRNSHDLKEALICNQRATEILEKLAEPDLAALGDSYNDHVVLCEAAGIEVDSFAGYHHALELFQQEFGEEHPLIAIALANIGCVFQKRSEYQVAERYFRRSLEILLKFCVSSHPNCQGVRRFLANCHNRQDHTRDALKLQLDIVASTPPGTVAALGGRLQIAKMKEQCGEPQNLAEVLREIRKDCDSVSDSGPIRAALRSFGNELNGTALHLKNVEAGYQEAERHYRAAIACVPEAPIFLNNLAQLLATVDERYSEAEVLFQHGLEIDPEEQTLHSNYGLLLQNVRRDFDAAESHYQLALAKEPNCPWFRGNYSTLLLIKGEIEAARVLVTETWSRFPNRLNRACLRHLFVRALIAELDGKGEQLFLRQLKTHLCSKLPHAPWPVSALLDELAPRLGEATSAFFRALSTAINDRRAVVGLEAFPLWISLAEESLDTPWPAATRQE